MLLLSQCLFLFLPGEFWHSGRMWEMPLPWLFLVVFTTSTTGYAVSPVVVVVLAVVVTIVKGTLTVVKGALFLAGRAMTSAFIWKKISLGISVELHWQSQFRMGWELAGDACLLETTVASLAHFSQVPDTIKQQQHSVRANPATSEMEK